MELKWLEDFIAITETLSFSRAADARYITQSAFSRRIQRLESWVGAPLINRATVPAELTPAGHDFLPVAQEIVRTLYASREMMQPMAKRGMLRLAALHTLTVTFFPAWLRKLELEMHGLRTVLIPDRGGIEANLAALTDGEADFFLTYAHPDVPLHLDSYHFEYLTVGSDKLMPVCTPRICIENEVVAGADIIDFTLKTKTKVPYLGYGFSSFFGVALQRLFAKQPPFKQQTVHENTISDGLKRLALTGVGLCWLPQSLVADDLRAGKLVPATQDDSWFLDLDVRLYRANDGNTQATDAFWTASKNLKTA